MVRAVEENEAGVPSERIPLTVFRPAGANRGSEDAFVVIRLSRFARYFELNVAPLDKDPNLGPSEEVSSDE